jgi:P27 family predicted phage terminase small subunit
MAKGPRGPRPTPTHLRVLRGNPDKRPINRPEPMPVVPIEIPPAPEYLIGYAREEWDRIAVELHRLNLLTIVDIQVLAAYCQAFKIWRTATEVFTAMAERDPVTLGLMIKATKTGTALQNPVYLTARQASNDMVRHAAEFGLSPAARARIAAGIYQEKTASKFDGLLAG